IANKRAKGLQLDAPLADLLGALTPSGLQKVKALDHVAASIAQDAQHKDSTPQSDNDSSANSSLMSFRPPYSGQGFYGGRNLPGEVHAENGSIRQWANATVADSSHSVAYLTQRLAVPSGARRVRVAVDFSGFYSMYAGGALGYASAEVLVNARLLEGSREL